jgi:hypothetical protein
LNRIFSSRPGERDLALLPANVLAGDNEARLARSVGVTAEESTGGDDRNQQGEYRNQIDESGIVTTVAEFPAH